jgi:hypothetical protein
MQPVSNVGPYSKEQLAQLAYLSPRSQAALHSLLNSLQILEESARLIFKSMGIGQNIDIRA